MEFHEKLQALRKQSGLTQEELAQKLYVSRTAVSKWESGRGYPNIDSLKAIAACFSVTVDDLLSGDEVLTIAQNEQKQQKAQMCDFLFVLLHLGTALLLVLPCFRQVVDGQVQAVTLLGLTAVASYMRVAYLLMVLLMMAIGIVRLWCPKRWVRYKTIVSLCLTAGGVMLFILGVQPYAAALLFVFLSMQVSLLLKMR